MVKRKIEDQENEPIERIETSTETLNPENMEEDLSELSDTFLEEQNGFEESVQNYEDEMSQAQEESEEKIEEIDMNNVLTNEEVTKDFLEKEFFRQKVVSTLVNFLSSFKDKKYVKRIKKMCSENKESLYISFMDVDSYNTGLSNLLVSMTEGIMVLFDRALEHVVKIHFPNYFMIKPKLHARITDVPVLENIRNLRNCHLNTLVRVNGVVTRRSGVFPLLSIVKYICAKCNGVFGPFVIEKDGFKPTQCLNCQSKGPFMVNSSETVYKDYQKMTLQEVPGTVPSGRLPRNKEILLFYDLIDCAKPGEEIEVIGTYKNNFSYSLNVKNGFPVFFTVIEAISINKKEDEFSNFKMTEEEEKEIIKISKHPNIKNIIFNSIAPSIYGHKSIKKAIALAMFGGQQKNIDNHVIRGDINVLLLGDPGTAKSQFLRYVEATSHRAVLATGQGSSSVGLTASVRKDPVTREWTLEGGALVLADRGVCLIDEFDKMNEGDRISIHEAMEQQSISISKAGIVASLHARCSVIAAANPTRGRYNSSLTFSQNVNLSDPIISRFDVLCVVKDIIEQNEDERLAGFVIDSHSKAKKEDEEEMNFNPQKMMFSQDFLKKYILYSRMHSFPKIKDVDMEKISNLYSELRKESMVTGSVPITVRHIEAIVRMSEAFSRMRLRDFVATEDIDQAIAIILDSFISAQKYSVTRSLSRKFSKYVDNNDNIDVLIFILGEMVKDKFKALSFREEQRVVSISVSDFETRVRAFGMKVKDDFFNTTTFKNAGYKYDATSKKISRSVQ